VLLTPDGCAVSQLFQRLPRAINEIGRVDSSLRSVVAPPKRNRDGEDKGGDARLRLDPAVEQAVTSIGDAAAREAAQALAATAPAQMRIAAAEAATKAQQQAKALQLTEQQMLLDAVKSLGGETDEDMVAFRKEALQALRAKMGQPPPQTLVEREARAALSQPPPVLPVAVACHAGPMHQFSAPLVQTQPSARANGAGLPASSAATHASLPPGGAGGGAPAANSGSSTSAAAGQPLVVATPQPPATNATAALADAASSAPAESDGSAEVDSTPDSEEASPGYELAKAPYCFHIQPVGEYLGPRFRTIRGVWGLTALSATDATTYRDNTGGGPFADFYLRSDQSLSDHADGALVAAAQDKTFTQEVRSVLGAARGIQNPTADAADAWEKWPHIEPGTMARAVAKLPTLSGGSPEMEVVVPHGDSEPAPGASAEKIEACNAAVSRYAAFLVLEEFDGSMSWSCIRKIGSCWYDFSPLGYDDQLRETGESEAEAEAIASRQASSPRTHDASL